MKREFKQVYMYFQVQTSPFWAVWLVSLMLLLPLSIDVYLCSRLLISFLMDIVFSSWFKVAVLDFLKYWFKMHRNLIFSKNQKKTKLFHYAVSFIWLIFVSWERYIWSMLLFWLITSSDLLLCLKSIYWQN